MMAVDIEANSLQTKRVVEDSVKVWSVAYHTGDEEDFFLWDNLTAIELSDMIYQWVTNGNILLFHNASYDIPTLRLRGVQIPKNHPGRIFWLDTMLMSYALGPSGSQHHSLSNLASLVDEVKYEQPNFINPDVTALKRYNLQDCRITWKLGQYFLPLLMEDEENWEHFIMVEQPYTEIIIQLEQGVMIDRVKLSEYEKELSLNVTSRLTSIQQEVGFLPTAPKEYSKKTVLRSVRRPNGSIKSEMVGYNDIFETDEEGNKTGQKTRIYDHCPLAFFNPNSGDDLSDYLVSAGWKPTTFTSTGKVKTDQKTLESIQDKFPIVRAILQWKKLETQLNTFVRPIGERLTKDSILYGDFNQCQTVTRRLSSSNPNLQNIPARGENGAAIRRLFVARPGNQLVVGDLDRIEICVLGFYLELLYGDTTISAAIRNKIDVHDVNARTWGIPRKEAKNTIFCIIYGGGEKRIAQTAGVTLEKASNILKQIEKHLPALLQFREDVVEIVEEEEGFFNDYLGGLYYVPEITSENNKVYHAAKRQIGNYIIQGTAGSVFKFLQLEAHLAIHEVYQGRELIVVHDESVYEAVKAAEAAEYLTSVYSNDTLLRDDDVVVPISATFKVASNWYDAKGD